MLKNVWAVIGIPLIMVCGLFIGLGNVAASASSPQETVQRYLNSLASGDTKVLVDLIDGSMKDRGHRLLTENPGYSQFLRTQYAGVVMTIESITQAGDDYNVQVRFDYPTSDSTTTRFTLKLIDGGWKVVNEESL
jgi:hypothetical protein